MKTSEYLKLKLSEQLGAEVSHIERSYCNRQRHEGEWVYSFSIKVTGSIWDYGCYYTMGEIAAHLKAGGSVSLTHLVSARFLTRRHEPELWVEGELRNSKSLPR